MGVLGTVLITVLVVLAVLGGFDLAGLLLAAAAIFLSSVWEH